MVKNPVSKAEFSRVAGISNGMATKLTKDRNARLYVALVGKRIDLNHDATAKYLAERLAATTGKPSPAPGIDPLYEKAVQFCLGHKRPSANSLRKALGVGGVRSTQIFDTIKASGILDVETRAPKAAADPLPEPVRAVSGQEKKKSIKKTAALEVLNEGGTVHNIPEDIEKFADMTLRELIQRFGSDVAFGDWLKAVKDIEDINGKRLKNAVSKGKLVSRELVKVGIIDPIDAVHIRLLTDGAKTIARRATAMHSAEKPLEDIEKFVADQITSFIRPVKSKVARALANA